MYKALMFEQLWVGDQVVIILASFSYCMSLNPAEVFSIIPYGWLKRTKINEKEAGNGPFSKFLNLEPHTRWKESKDDRVV